MIDENIRLNEGNGPSYPRCSSSLNGLLINLDYIKGMDTFNKNSSEFQAIGHYVMDLKTLITEDINASIWTSVQNNRSGVTMGKGLDEVNSENDGQMGLSDRIIQQCTHGFIMRYKTTEELALEGNRFGNIKLVCVKKRRLAGKDAQDLLHPVKTANGKFMNNYFNLDTKGFAYWDKGALGKIQSPCRSYRRYSDNKRPFFPFSEYAARYLLESF